MAQQFQRVASNDIPFALSTKNGGLAGRVGVTVKSSVRGPAREAGRPHTYLRSECLDSQHALGCCKPRFMLGWDRFYTRKAVFMRTGPSHISYSAFPPGSLLSYILRKAGWDN